MNGLSYVRAYLDDILSLSNKDIDDHLVRLDVVLTRLQRAGLRVHAGKSKFCVTKVEYLGYLISREGIRPQISKVRAIQRLKIPRTVRDVRKILGLVQYYRDLWPRRSHTLAPLTELVSTKGLSTEIKKNKLRPIKWTEKCEKAFLEMKRLVNREVLLAYPRFDVPFEVYTDASQYQLGAVITQLKKPLAFYSRKLSTAQTKYTTREQELLSVVETLKEFRNILFGYEVIVYTDHKNLVHETLVMSSDRVMRWRLLLEEYGITFKHIAGDKNIIADFLSRYPVYEDSTTEEIMELCAVSPTETEAQFPLDLSKVATEQQNEKRNSKEFNKYYKNNKKDFNTKIVSNKTLISVKDKIYIPKTLRSNIVNWYHYFLCHPGRT